MEKAINADFLVIGGGSGGVRAARVAAQLGANVVLAERDALGGTCVNRGCVPKKFLVYASMIGREQAKLRKGIYGWRSDHADFDWPTLKKDIDTQISRLNGIYGNTLNTHGVDVRDGDAVFVDQHHVRIGDTLFRADKILIAVGGIPVRPNIEGGDLAMVSDDAFEMKDLPASILVVGGGYIALEFANIFDGLGADVCLAYRGELFLRGFDDSLRKFLRTSMEARGMNMRFGLTPVRISKHKQKGLEIEFDDGSVDYSQAVMYAIGRVPAFEGLGIEHAGVKLNERGRIEVDSGYTTSVPHIYALGDVVGGLELTPVAIAEAEFLARRLYGDWHEGVDLIGVPTAVFSQPELASVGLTEAEARAIYPEACVYEQEFTPLRASLFSEKFAYKEKCLIKIIAQKEDDSAPIVGAHMAGSGSAEVIQMMALAIKSGACLLELRRTIGLHPTTAEEFVTLYKRAYT